MYGVHKMNAFTLHLVLKFKALFFQCLFIVIIPQLEKQMSILLMRKLRFRHIPWFDGAQRNQ